MQVLRPVRASHSYTQRLAGRPEEVFPLLCPVRECDWVDGWDPRLVISGSGVAEQDCLFVTSTATSESVWVVTEYTPPAHIAFVKVTPDETVGFIDIVLSAAADGGTDALVTYTFTALSEQGVAAVNAFTAAYYREFMVAWEAQLNHFLRTGEKMGAEA
jgi:hypothetical protein